MKFTCFKDNNDEWRWHAVADNGKIVADSAEGYKNQHDCIGQLNKIFAFVRDEGGYPIIEIDHG